MRDLEGLFEKQEAYRDIDIRFRRNPVTNDVVSLNSIESIKQSVRLLVLTNFYERPMQPKIGTRIRSSLFELFDLNLVDMIQKEIRGILDRFEPRVQVKEVEVTEKPNDHTLDVRIVYLIYGRVQRVEQVINLQRVR